MESELHETQVEKEEEEEEEEFSVNDINKERFDYIFLGSGLTENILGA